MGSPPWLSHRASSGDTTEQLLQKRAVLVLVAEAYDQYLRACTPEPVRVEREGRGWRNAPSRDSVSVRQPGVVKDRDDLAALTCVLCAVHFALLQIVSARKLPENLTCPHQSICEERQCEAPDFAQQGKHRPDDVGSEGFRDVKGTQRGDAVSCEPALPVDVVGVALESATPAAPQNLARNECHDTPSTSLVSASLSQERCPQVSRNDKIQGHHCLDVVPQTPVKARAADVPEGRCRTEEEPGCDGAHIGARAGGWHAPWQMREGGCVGVAPPGPSGRCSTGDPPCHAGAAVTHGQLTPLAVSFDGPIAGDCWMQGYGLVVTRRQPGGSHKDDVRMRLTVLHNSTEDPSQRLQRHSALSVKPTRVDFEWNQELSGAVVLAAPEQAVPRIAMSSCLSLLQADNMNVCTTGDGVAVLEWHSQGKIWSEAFRIGLKFQVFSLCLSSSSLAAAGDFGHVYVWQNTLHALQDLPPKELPQATYKTFSFPDIIDLRFVPGKDHILCASSSQASIAVWDVLNSQILMTAHSSMQQLSRTVPFNFVLVPGPYGQECVDRTFQALDTCPGTRRNDGGAEMSDLCPVAILLATWSDFETSKSHFGPVLLYKGSVPLAFPYPINAGPCFTANGTLGALVTAEGRLMIWNILQGTCLDCVYMPWHLKAQYVSFWTTSIVFVGLSDGSAMLYTT